MNNRKSRYYIRVLAGGYLLYLGYSLIKSTMTEHLTKVYLAFGLLFAVLGAAIGGSALVSVLKIEKEERQGGGNPEAQEEETPEPLEAGEAASLPEKPEAGEGMPVEDSTDSTQAVPAEERAEDEKAAPAEKRVEDEKAAPAQEERMADEEEKVE